MKILTLIFSLLACSAFAGTVYKYTDSNGNVIYSDSKPDNGEVDTINITPSSNTYQSDNDNQQEQDVLLEQQQQINTKEKSAQNDKQSQKENLRQAVKKAEKNVKNAKVIREGDMFPLPSGGIRYSDQYKNRVNAAEAALEQAKKTYQSEK